MLETNKLELKQALAIYKDRYTTLASIDMEQLEDIIKEIKENDSNTTTQQSDRTRRPRNK